MPRSSCSTASQIRKMSSTATVAAVSITTAGRPRGSPGTGSFPITSIRKIEQLRHDADRTETRHIGPSISHDAYRYHIAIENHAVEHHWTEKLADPLLGFSLPFYFGCPNVSEYLPEASFIPITMDDPQATAELIRQAIRRAEWTRRLPAIRAARRMFLDVLGIFPTLSRLIEAWHDGTTGGGGMIRSRRSLRKSRPTAFFTEMGERACA